VTAVPIVASVVQTTAVPHPPWFAQGATGLVWVPDATTAKAFRVAQADVLRLPRASGWWSQPIVGPTPSNGLDGPDPAAVALDAL